jgi:hypothetical protein
LQSPLGLPLSAHIEFRERQSASDDEFALLILSFKDDSDYGLGHALAVAIRNRTVCPYSKLALPRRPQVGKQQLLTTRRNHGYQLSNYSDLGTLTLHLGQVNSETESYDFM